MFEFELADSHGALLRCDEEGVVHVAPIAGVAVQPAADARQAGSSSSDNQLPTGGCSLRIHAKDPHCPITVALAAQADDNDGYGAAGEHATTAQQAWHYGLLGVVDLQVSKHLYFVTARKKVATMAPTSSSSSSSSSSSTNEDRQADIYQITGVSKVLLTRISYLTLTQEQWEREALRGMDVVLSSGWFFYTNSPTFDLTARAQDGVSQPANVCVCRFKEFLWNERLLEPVVAQEAPIVRNLRSFFVPVIAGYVGSTTVSLPPVGTGDDDDGDDKRDVRLDVTMTLISRIDKRFAGRRLYCRGLDPVTGHCAAHVESELLVQARNCGRTAQTPRAHPRACEQTATFSAVQLRGSVPVVWSQLPRDNDLLYKPPIIIQGADEDDTRRRDNFSVSRQYFTQLTARYPKVGILDLLDRENKQEGTLSEQFELAVANCHAFSQLVAPSAPHETSLLYHNLQLTGKSVEAYSCTLDLAQRLVKQHGVFVSLSSSTVVSEQGGAIRTNCLDCVDRSNIIQCLISQEQLEYMLDVAARDTVLGDNLHSTLCNKATPDGLLRHRTRKQLFASLRSLWIANGDAIADLFIGTPSLNSRVIDAFAYAPYRHPPPAAAASSAQQESPSRRQSEADAVRSRALRRTLSAREGLLPSFDSTSQQTAAVEPRSQPKVQRRHTVFAKSQHTSLRHKKKKHRTTSAGSWGSWWDTAEVTAVIMCRVYLSRFADPLIQDILDFVVHGPAASDQAALPGAGGGDRAAGARQLRRDLDFRVKTHHRLGVAECSQPWPAFAFVTLRKAWAPLRLPLVSTARDGPAGSDRVRVARQWGRLLWAVGVTLAWMLLTAAAKALSRVEHRLLRNRTRQGQEQPAEAGPPLTLFKTPRRYL
ncbi:hypothetical protein RI367_002382 [Sorochytrium milnesiophthora]